jgi:flagellar hook protein FlgE
MLQSMFSGISGLRSHQRRMDVIGNDIANVNTPGYKESAVTFKEAYVTTLRAPAPGTPGQQVGLGVQVGGITKNFRGGILMETGQSSNMGVSGEGFFIVAERGAPAVNNYFTRAGDFQLDVYDDGGGAETFLINPDGMRLRGVLVGALGDPPPDLTGLTEADLEDITLPDDTSSFSIGLDGVIYVSIAGASPQAWGRVALARFDNTGALEAVGSNLFRQNPAAGIRAFANPGESGTGQTFQGYLENSNVDLAQEFSDMIITQRGFQANSRSITTSDEMLMELLTLKR